jgi:2'-5' RNA ligase
MQRIFAAVHIQSVGEILGLLKNLQSALIRDKIKWVETQNLHLTLKFFGQTSENVVDKIAKTLSNIKPMSTFPLKFSGLGVFGSSYQPRVIWLGLGQCKELLKLQNEIISSIKPLGYLPDRQNFVPHLTLGRINYLNDKKYFNEVIEANRSFSAESQIIYDFRLYESKLKPSGPEYTILRSYNLGE